MTRQMEHDLTQERRDHLYWLWSEETEAPETQEWRDDLTPAEAAYVASLDRGYRAGCTQIATAILVMEDIYRDFPLRQIRQITRQGCRCRLELVDGRVFDCGMDADRKIHYIEEESQA